MTKLYELATVQNPMVAARVKHVDHRKLTPQQVDLQRRNAAAMRRTRPCQVTYYNGEHCRLAVGHDRMHRATVEGETVLFLACTYCQAPLEYGGDTDPIPHDLQGNIICGDSPTTYHGV